MTRRCLPPAATALAAALLVAALAAQEVTVTRPIRAMILTASGKQYTGELVALNGKEVKFHPFNMGVLVFKADKVTAVRTADKLYVYNAQAKRFEEKALPELKPAAPDAPPAVPPPPLPNPPAPPAVKPPEAPSPFGLPDKPAPSIGGKDGGAGKAQTVIAEGVGALPDAALKDAFRNAVQQVVGAVVDSETLIKNDQVISDQVLTYSDGLVKAYKTLAKSEKGGLHRIKIAADVERRSVVAKLKAARVSVKDVDGEGLFGEITTQLDAAKKAQALLENALKDFPFGCLEADVSRPNILEKDETRVKFRLDFVFRVEPKAYAAASARLHNTLKGIALDGGQFVYAGKPDDHVPGHFYPPPALGFRTLWQKLMPRAFPGERPVSDPNVVTVALCTQMNQLREQSAWSYFVLDESVRPALLRLAFNDVKAKVSFLDADGKLITVDQFPISELQRAPYAMSFAVNLITPMGVDRTLAPEDGRRLDKKGRKCSWFLVAPVFFQQTTGRGDYVSAVPYSRGFTLSLDEVRNTKKIVCEILFN